MIKSMTGFGKQSVEIGGRTYQIEIRAVNSKQLDLTLKITSAFRDLETEIRALINNLLVRGKIEVCIFSDRSKSDSSLRLNVDTMQQHYSDLLKASKILGIDLKEDVMTYLIRMPEVYTNDMYEFKEEDFHLISKAVKKCITDFDAFRMEEGAALEKDLCMRVDLIKSYIGKVEIYEKERITTVRKNLVNGLEKYLSNIQLDQNRLEQEIIYYIEKFDVTEEKIRLFQHCDYFVQTMQEEASGKKLAFIAQEMGREINTLGSKANHVEIQKIVVNMKDELEKIKEQLSNIL